MFVADVFTSVPRTDQRAKGECYLRDCLSREVMSLVCSEDVHREAAADVHSGELLAHDLFVSEAGVEEGHHRP